MHKVREVVAYKDYFEKFLVEQPNKVQDKIFKIIEAIETFERVPSHYLKHLVSFQKMAFLVTCTGWPRRPGPPFLLDQKRRQKSQVLMENS